MLLGKKNGPVSKQTINTLTKKIHRKFPPPHLERTSGSQCAFFQVSLASAVEATIEISGFKGYGDSTWTWKSITTTTSSWNLCRLIWAKCLPIQRFLSHNPRLPDLAFSETCFAAFLPNKSVSKPTPGFPDGSASASITVMEVWMDNLVLQYSQTPTSYARTRHSLLCSLPQSCLQSGYNRSLSSLLPFSAYIVSPMSLCTVSLSRAYCGKNGV